MTAAPTAAVDAAAASGLHGRTALVTGAGSDVTPAVARALARAGARVTVCGGTNADLGVGGEQEPISIVESHAELTAALDILVTCAAPPQAVTLADLTEAGWRAALDGGVTAAMVVTRDVLPLLVGHGEPGSAGSSVVHIGSTVGLRGEAGAAAPATAAAGLAGLTRSLAKELGPQGVRVNMIATGPVAVGRPDQVAAIAVFLAGDASAGINGEVIVADGAA